jgi:hypothetical protein
MDELRAEGDVEMEELCVLQLVSQPGHSDEAVEIADAPSRGLEVHRVAAAEESGHHRLGDTGRERRCHGCIGRVAAVLENLDTCGHRRRMAARYSRLHRDRSYRADVGRGR